MTTSQFTPQVQCQPKVKRRTFSPQLFFLEPDTLSSKILGQDARVVLSVSLTTVDSPREFLRSVVLVQEVVSDLLEIGKVSVEEGGTESSKVRVLGVVDFDYSPRVATSANHLPVDFDFFFRANDGKGEESLAEKGGERKPKLY